MADRLYARLASAVDAHVGSELQALSERAKTASAATTTAPAGAGSESGDYGAEDSSRALFFLPQFDATWRSHCTCMLTLRQVFAPLDAATATGSAANRGGGGANTSAGVGSGGMATKVAAARIAVEAGCAMCVASGHVENPLQAVVSGARSTWFLPTTTPRAARKQWIAGALQPAGKVAVDAGAAAALARGKSLLPAGVLAVAGRFERGDAVSILDPEGREIARGLAAYSAADALRIRGRKSADIESLVGFRGREELVHRDDLVMLVPAARGKGT